MLKIEDIWKNKTLLKYLAYIFSLTLISFLMINRSRQISDFILKFHTPILAVAVFILIILLLIQRKQTSILLENERLYCELQLKQSHIDRDMAMAKTIQQSILSEKIPRIQGWKISAFFMPAKDIGGDFYGIKQKNGSLHFYLGDVSGHGISSALLMSLTNGLVQEMIKQLDSPAEILNYLNKTLCHYLHNSINFVTMFYGRIDLKKRELQYASAGHPPALVFRKNVPIPLKIKTDRTMLGMFKHNGYINKSLQLKAGDKLLIYTDGFLESRDKQNKELGENFLINVVKENLAVGGDKLKELIYKKTAESAKIITDDLSLLVLEC